MTGIEMIAKERQEQIEKHGRTIEKDVRENSDYQLSIGALKLLDPTDQLPPNGWDINIYNKMRHKPYKDRLIIAGALIAAEIDRLEMIGKK